MTIRELLERRSTIVAEMRGLTNSPSGEAGDLSADQSQRFDTLKTELAGVEKNIDRQRLVDEAERRMTGVPVTGSGNDDFGKACREFSIQKALASRIEPGAVDAGREIEVSKELAKRAGRAVEGIMIPLEAFVPLEKRVLTVAGDAGNLVQTTVLANEFIDALRPASVSIRLGARVITGLTGNIALPKMDALTPAATWIADNSALSADDNSFTQLTGSPHHLGLLTEVSRKTILQTNPGIESIIRADFAAKLAAGVDKGVLSGAGTNEPTGITHTSGVNTVSSSNSDPTWSQVISAMSAPKQADVPESSLGWAMNAYAESKFRRTVKVSNFPEYLIDDETPGTMAGLPYAITSQLPGVIASPTQYSTVIFGAWNQVIVCFWSGVEILLNPFESTAFTKGNVQIRGLVDADVIVRHGEAFTVWSGINIV